MSFENPDYDNHPEKHYVRYLGWTPVSKNYRQRNSNKPPKYFTLCAKQALDIFTLEKEGILQRDGNKNLPNVTVCEKDDSDAAEIFKVVRPPLKNAIIIGLLEELILYDESNREIQEILQKAQSGERLSRSDREKIRTYEKSRSLKDTFPFDIINIDACSSFLNTGLTQNKMCQTLKKIFELQKSTQSFLLFITNPIRSDGIASDAIRQLKADFQSNRSHYKEIDTAIKTTFGNGAYYETIPEENRISFCFAKSVVMPAAIGWSYKHHGIFIYSSPNGTKMMSSIIEFTKINQEKDETNYLDELVRIIKEMPLAYSKLDKSIKDRINQHFESVKQYRDRIPAEFSKQ
jgi:hypothetical protein